MEVRPSARGRVGEPGEVLAGMEQAGQRNGEPAVVGVAADLLAEALPRHERRLNTEVRERPAGLDQVTDMRWSVGEVEEPHSRHSQSIASSAMSCLTSPYASSVSRNSSRPVSSP